MTTCFSADNLGKQLGLRSGHTKWLILIQTDTNGTPERIFERVSFEINSRHKEGI